MLNKSMYRQLEWYTNLLWVEKNVKFQSDIIQCIHIIRYVINDIHSSPLDLKCCKKKKFIFSINVIIECNCTTFYGVEMKSA